ncbi:hypothetical protein [Flammeovirga sp. SubArs3]|uniref:hypothetical protein n=1 Tax=Flammeovirga sp. SubArs3 TaxID=2995316 RepID=UPI00248AC2E5|nr:hypothetical protein [Flammeovirga sp. SubArs3]
MKAYSIFIFIAALLISCGNSEENWSKDQIIDHVAQENTTGTGYRDLEGKFIDYEYVDFGSFRLAIYNNSIKWKGYGGYFDGIVSKVTPKITKVSEGVYFLSWVFGENGGDNVVVNFNTKKVYAHLRSGNADENSPADFEMIHGNVKCGPSTSCTYPEGEPISMIEMIFTLYLNTKKFDLPPIFETKKPLIEEHLTARKELAEEPIKYQSEKGEVVIQVAGDITKVSINGENPKEYQTNVTKINNGVYFISWLGNDQFGEHIVFNKNQGKVYDHMNFSLEREELIFPEIK